MNDQQKKLYESILKRGYEREWTQIESQKEQRELLLKLLQEDSAGIKKAEQLFENDRAKFIKLGLLSQSQAFEQTDKEKAKRILGVNQPNFAKLAKLITEKLPKSNAQDVSSDFETLSDEEFFKKYPQISRAELSDI